MPSDPHAIPTSSKSSPLWADDIIAGNPCASCRGRDIVRVTACSIGALFGSKDGGGVDGKLVDVERAADRLC